MELVLATRNRDKIREIRSYLEDLGIDVLALDAFPEVGEVTEDGASYEENARKKAQAVAAATGRLALADDTGLEVDTLNGAPGLYSARYAGERVSYADNRDKLLAVLQGVTPEKRTARFRCVMVLARPDGQTRCVEGVVEGRITDREIGEGGFGYDPIFYLPDLGKTLAQLTLAEKNRVSHRGRALAQVRELLKELNQ